MNDIPSSSNSISRRDFLKTGSAAAAGAAILGGLSIERAAHAQGDDAIKIALIGCGGRGTGACGQALSVKPNVKLIAMADVFRDRLDGSYDQLTQHFANRIDVPEERKFIGFDAYKKAIEAADVVVIATPPGFRPVHFPEAVRQGKNVFMEKPVAVDAPGVRKILAAAEEAKQKNLKVAVGLQRHHQKGYIETIQRLHDGAIGDVTSMRCYWVDNGVWVHPRRPEWNEMEYQMRNWYYFVWLCGDHIVEQHIHNLDVINWVKGGYPVRAQGQGGRQVRVGPQYGQIFDHHSVQFEYADGSICASQCRHMHGCWNSVSEHVVGTKGHCNVGDYRIAGENAWRHDGRHDRNPYQQEHDDFFDAIVNNKTYNEAENGAKSTMTAIFGRMCTYSGKMISWEEALNSKVDLSPKVYAWDAAPPVLPDERGEYPVPVPGETEVL